jgi:DNA (cytosine-5)-methyltransferase 1
MTARIQTSEWSPIYFLSVGTVGDEIEVDEETALRWREAVNELALFAGAGGGILGGTLLGWRTVCAVEFDPYARDVLVARQNDGCLPPFPIWDDVRTFDGRPWRGVVDVVSGGFPCQDISAAGKGAGIGGARSGLWREMARIVGEVRPRFVWVENSPMLVGRGLGLVLLDLAAMGFSARWGVVGACDAGAPHQRKRIWILAHSEGGGCVGQGGLRGESRQCHQEEVGREVQHQSGNNGSSELVADTLRERSEAGAANPPRREEGDSAKPLDGCDLRHAAGAGLPHGATEPMGKPEADTQPERSDWWATEPDVGRVAHGVAARVDRLRCIGNGQVPGVAAMAWRILSMHNAQHDAGGRSGANDD